MAPLVFKSLSCCCSALLFNALCFSCTLDTGLFYEQGRGGVGRRALCLALLQLLLLSNVLKKAVSKALSVSFTAREEEKRQSGNGGGGESERETAFLMW